jgi:hypothetical protein
LPHATEGRASELAAGATAAAGQVEALEERWFQPRGGVVEGAEGLAEQDHAVDEGEGVVEEDHGAPADQAEAAALAGLGEEGGVEGLLADLDPEVNCQTEESTLLLGQVHGRECSLAQYFWMPNGPLAVPWIFPS